MNFYKGDIVLLPYPFTDLTTVKVRPAVVIASNKSKYNDVFVVPITSKIDNLNFGEFVINYLKSTGLHVSSAIKRGCFLVDTYMIRKKLGRLESADLNKLNDSIKTWLEL